MYKSKICIQTSNRQKTDVCIFSSAWGQKLKPLYSNVHCVISATRGLSIETITDDAEKYHGIMGVAVFIVTIKDAEEQSCSISSEQYEQHSRPTN